ncbi:MAG: pyruvate synthase [Methanobacteriota archaeon]|nr:MAG: pyruvate synthase [Euryarchaeota archaeon]
MGQMLEIRWHARGGQGAKTASILFAEAAIEEGKYAQGFPDYGPERMGAPMRAFNRISDEPIMIHSAIYHPKFVVVLDPTLLDAVDVTEGVPEDGVLVVNTPKTPAEIRKQLNLEGRKVYTLNATQIALDEFGKPIPNTVMVGALTHLTGVLNVETFKEGFRQKFQKKLTTKILEGNMKAIDRAIKEVQGE